MREIRTQLGRCFGHQVHKHIEVNTVDGFQGQEKDIIIFSCVRASSEKSIGFLRDTRRLNVALTRAKCSLYIIGHSNVLSGHPIWGALIGDAKKRGLFVPYSGMQPWKKISTSSISTGNLFGRQDISSDGDNHDKRQLPDTKQAPKTSLLSSDRSPPMDPRLHMRRTG